LDTLVDLFSIAGFEVFFKNSRGNYRSYSKAPTLKHLIACCEEVGTPDAWVKVMKYKLCAYFSYWNGQELPSCPFTRKDHPGVVLGGRAYRFQSKLLLKEVSVFQSLVASILYSKNGMPLVTDKKILERACAETMDSLAIAPTPVKPISLVSWNDLDLYSNAIETHLDQDSIEKQIDRTVDELFSGALPLDIDDLFEPFFPSTSANAEVSIMEGGSVKVIRNLIEELSLQGKKLVQISPFAETTFTGPVFDPSFEEIRELGSEDAVLAAEDTFWQEVDDGVKPDQCHGYDYRVSYVELRNRFSLVYSSALAKAMTESPDVIPVALPEPLKIRVITKGPPLTYFVLKPLQKKMLDIIQRCRVFQLTGKPVTEQIVQESMRSLQPGEKFKSGDYKAATNNLKSWTSERAARRISLHLKLSPELTELFVRSLTGHILPNGRKQRNGQLMGSVTSFPILCIINAALTRWAMEIGENRSLKLDRLRLLINGDDVVFPINKIGEEAWKSITSAAGLEESVGKSFYSEYFLTINSREYLVHDISLGNKVELREIKHMNMGLLSGMERGSSKITLSNIGSFHSEMIQQCPESWLTKANLLFIIKNRSLLDTAGCIPWYMPKWLGGIGLTPWTENQRSLKDRRRALTVLRNIDQLRPIRDIPDCSWTTHNYIMSRIPTEEVPWQYVRTEFFVDQDLESNYQKLYALLAVEALFSLSIDQLRSQSRKSKSNKFKSHNTLIWSFALEHCSGGEGLSDFDLMDRDMSHHHPIQFITSAAEAQGLLAPVDLNNMYIHQKIFGRWPVSKPLQ
jgi:hypothetical protein